MRTLRKLCAAELGGSLKSLVLSGSFGRGEGSVLLHADGCVEPLRDYDVRLVVEGPVPRAAVEQVRSRFMQETGLGGTDERFSGERGFSLTLETLTTEEARTSFVRDRDLRAFDHLHASHVIWGEDLSEGLRFPAAEIPKVNGLRFLYQKMVGLVGHFGGPGSDDARQTLLYECHKTFIEICTALVLLAGEYVPSYRERARLFEAKWRVWFPELAWQLPDLADQIARSTQEKLFPGSTPAPNPVEMFYRTRKALLTVHRFYVHRLYGIAVKSGRRGSARLRKALYGDYYRVPVSKWLDGRGVDYLPARWVLNAAYQRLLRLKHARAAGLDACRAAWGCLRAGEAPPIDIFIAAWCALASLRGVPDVRLLRCAEDALARLPGMGGRKTGATDAWALYSVVRERLDQPQRAHRRQPEEEHGHQPRKRSIQEQAEGSQQRHGEPGHIG